MESVPRANFFKWGSQLDESFREWGNKQIGLGVVKEIID